MSLVQLQLDTYSKEVTCTLKSKPCFCYDYPLLRSVGCSGSWDDVFKVAVVLYIIGTLVWNIFSTGEKILD